jgi:ATP-dependent DNA helicase DinG
LIESDLPAATKAFKEATGKEISYAVLKGRHNYICLDRFHRGVDGLDEDQDATLFQESKSTLGKQAKKLRSWVEETETGDRDDYQDDVDPRIWRGVSISGRECVGAGKCPWGQECFAEEAKAKAFSADVVVTNHALLAIHTIENHPLIPDHDAIVIDEGHELVDRTTTALANSLDHRDIGRAAGMARKYIGANIHDKLIELGDDLEDILNNISAIGTMSRLETIPPALNIVLTGIRETAKAGVTELGSSSQDEMDEAAAKHRARSAMKELFDNAAEILTTDEHSVTWLDLSRTATLHHAPLSVAGFLRESLFGEQTVVMTSATLQVGGSMSATAKAVGLEDESDWTGLDVGSPFDYSKQGILYCAAHLPAPSSSGLPEEALDELVDLIEAAGGRTLSLFSSWRGVERAEEYLNLKFRDRDDRPLIVARKGDSVAELVRRFKETPESTLLGTVSLWQGIDVPGDTCTLVTIDRIPFPRPDDPVFAARSARVDESGGSGFRSVSLPRAALLLAQGVGRLIRSTEDRGVVAVLDSRLATANYGSVLRKSLPPLWWTTDKDSVTSALERLNDHASEETK